MKQIVKVKNLIKGDDLGGCIINSSSYYGNYCGSKNRYSVNVTYPSGETKTRIWGGDTTVTVMNRPEPQKVNYRFAQDGGTGHGDISYSDADNGL